MNLNANRIAVYLTALAAGATALAPIVADLDLTSTAGIIAGLVAIVTVVQKFLAGWQNYEKAIYQQQLIENEHAARLEQAAAVSKAGSRAPSPVLPR